MKPHDKWDVLPHGPIEKLADNLYTVVGTLPMPLGETTRRMTIARFGGHRLAIYSPIALDETQMLRLQALGDIDYLVVPSAVHRIDVKPWKDRFPSSIVVAPEAARAAVGDIVSVDATSVDLRDPHVTVMPVPGTGESELVMIVATATGRTLVVNDLIFNLPRARGLAGLGLRALGFGPGHPTIPKLVRKKLVRDEEALRAALREWAQLPGLERILPAHGAPITNARDTLLDLANAA